MQDGQQASKEPVKLAKSITAIGFFGIGLSGVFGTSWLLTTNSWLERAGGPEAAVLAFVLCFLVELPLILAYYEAVPMMPLAGGEMSYAYLCFGGFCGMIVGWFGVLVNIILCAWEALAISRLVGNLWPGVQTEGVLYSVLGSDITLPAVVLGLLLICGIAFVAFRGAKLAANFGTVIATVVSSIALIMVVVSVAQWDPAALSAQLAERMADPETAAASKDVLTGSIGLLAMLPFSVAGWESVAKGAQEASASVSHKKIGLMLVLAVAVATVLYIATMVAPTLIVPWTDLIATDESGSFLHTAPFAWAMGTIGLPVLGTLLIVAACLGVVGVYNAVFFAAIRQLFAMSEIGLVPKVFSKLHATHRTPVYCILLVSAISAVILFLGQSMFIPLIDIAAVCYIVLWGSTLASVMRARAVYPDLRRPARYPGGKPLMYVGLAVAIVLLVLILVPFPGNPAALPDPAVEYPLLLVLLAIGIGLYLVRDKSVPPGTNTDRLLREIAEQQELAGEASGASADAGGADRSSDSEGEGVRERA